MSYPPNVKAAKYLATEIIPILIKSHPDIKLLIAGASPTSSVKNLASPNIEVSGWMDNITDAYNNSKIFVAPMEIGTGMQNKILEAMAMKVPCITSELAAVAIGATHKKNILIGKTPEEYANFILELLVDSHLSSSLANSAHSFVQEKYSWSTNGIPLLNLIKFED